MILRRRNRTIIDLLGNIFIHNAARSRLSPQRVELCKEQIELFSTGSTGESVKGGGGKTSELLCNKLWRMNIGSVEDSVAQETHSCLCKMMVLLTDLQLHF